MIEDNEYEDFDLWAEEDLRPILELSVIAREIEQSVRYIKYPSWKDVKGALEQVYMHGGFAEIEVLKPKDTYLEKVVMDALPQQFRLMFFTRDEDRKKGIGTQKKTDETKTSNTYAYGSTVGSLEGDVNILALQGDINVVAQDINILEARETSTHSERHEFKQTGLTVSITSPIISAIETAQGLSDKKKRTTSSRSKALADGAIILNAVNLQDELTNAFDILSQEEKSGLAGGLMSTGKGKGQQGVFGISASIGTSKSESTSQNQQNTPTSKAASLPVLKTPS